MNFVNKVNWVHEYIKNFFKEDIFVEMIYGKKEFAKFIYKTKENLILGDVCINTDFIGNIYFENKNGCFTMQHISSELHRIEKLYQIECGKEGLYEL